jgi:hypothetical protein
VDVLAYEQQRRLSYLADKRFPAAHAQNVEAAHVGVLVILHSTRVVSLTTRLPSPLNIPYLMGLYSYFTCTLDLGKVVERKERRVAGLWRRLGRRFHDQVVMDAVVEQKHALRKPSVLSIAQATHARDVKHDNLQLEMVCENRELDLTTPRLVILDPRAVFEYWTTEKHIIVLLWVR